MKMMEVMCVISAVSNVWFDSGTLMIKYNSQNVVDEAIFRTLMLLHC